MFPYMSPFFLYVRAQRKLGVAGLLRCGARAGDALNDRFHVAGRVAVENVSRQSPNRPVNRWSCLTRGTLPTRADRKPDSGNTGQESQAFEKELDMSLHFPYTDVACFGFNSAV